MLSLLTRVYVITVAVLSVLGLMYVYLMPPASLLHDRDGIAHFTPPVEHMESGNRTTGFDVCRCDGRVVSRFSRR